MNRENQSATANFVLRPYRSLGNRGFLILMTFVGVVSFIAGAVFVSLGAWPVTGFFGLDAALIYWAFKINYRDGEMFETVDISPETLKLTRKHPSGREEIFDFNPYWARVHLTVDRPDGRTSLKLAAQGREVGFAKFLNDDERKDLAQALSAALAKARTASAF